MQVGVRETRRIVGEYQLTGEDVLSTRYFDDAIARGAYPVDIHNPSGRGTTLERLPRGGLRHPLAVPPPSRCGAGPRRRPLHLG
ncbi:FAD-dependent oxidoreductase [Streptomyces sp. NBC_01353]|uniref:FAD-dependent oxidoreductase n=1 Tax=Streptomyces sp. NBC_01353 TaxID=2903835 RepID=UPI002E306139|nr:FAD-dependent oxidoreductase [Streptomyces sp. NBC_01353]